MSGLWLPPASRQPPIGPHLWIRRPGLILPPLPKVPYPFLAAPALVNTAASSSLSASTGTLAMPSSVTSGNMLLVVVFWANTNSNAVSITKSSGTATIGSATQVGTRANTTGASLGAGNSTANVALFSVPITGSGSLTLQVAITSTGFYGWTQMEWSGLTTTLDGTEAAAVTSVATSGSAPFTVTANNVVTSQANSLICAWTTDDGGASTWSGTAGSTYSIQGTGSITGEPGWFVYKVAGAGTYTPNLQWGATSSANSHACIGALALAASGGAMPQQFIGIGSKYASGVYAN